MLDRIVTHAELLDRINELGRSRRLIGPVKRIEPDCSPPVRYMYQPVLRAEQLALEFTYCVYGPKAALLPPRETLFEFKRADGRFHAVPAFDDRPTALVGVHPCDLHALHTLDKVFSEATPDEHYLARRRNLMLIGIDCPTPCSDTAFCRDMGTNAVEKGADVVLYPLERPGETAIGRYGVAIGTAAGEEWLADAGRPAEVSDERMFKRYTAQKEDAFVPALDVAPGDLPEILNHSYDSLIWDATARRCYSCGSCNLVCPTCYCFDIQEENDLPPDSGRRERFWDGCMLRDFAVVAGNHNFRPHQAQRLRHRIYRKAKWIFEATGRHGCVGCARCDRACTAHISIREILNQLTEEVSHASA